jgi:fructoselysine 6-kinase
MSATRASPPRLVALGDNCLDAFLGRDMLTVGGNALNVAAHWRRAGWNARYFGAVGDDPEGRIVLAEVAAAGLDPDDVEVRPGETAVTLLRDRSGDRTFLLESFGVGEGYLPGEAAYAAAAAADWVHLGTNANRDLVRRLAAERVPFSLDLSTKPFALPLAGVPLAFASGPDEAGAAVGPLAEALRAAGAAAVVVTCGSRGAFFSDGTGLLHAPAVPVAVVDTCGAGDSFIAAFLAASRCERLAPPDALGRAAAAAAATCTHLGGFPQGSRAIPAWLPEKYAEVINEEAAGRA